MPCIVTQARALSPRHKQKCKWDPWLHQPKTAGAMRCTDPKAHLVLLLCGCAEQVPLQQRQRSRQAQAELPVCVRLLGLYGGRGHLHHLTQVGH
jgi:hypothetical protein